MLWLKALNETLHNGEACVLVTIAHVEGSTPRRVGARMLVSVDKVIDTVGGGALEFQAIDQARSLLSQASTEPVITSHKTLLGPDVVQCCGGSITLNYEYHPACALNVVIFGAGHVALCIAKLLADIPCRAQFYDSRVDWLEKIEAVDVTYGSIVTHKLGKNVFEAVEQCPDNAFYFVMTHSHEVDFDVVEAVLSRGDSAYCGLIASRSKARKFEMRLSRKGFTQVELDKLTAPIGSRAGSYVGPLVSPLVSTHGDSRKSSSNLPMEVAIAAVSELLQVRDERVKSPASANADVASITYD